MIIELLVCCICDGPDAGTALCEYHFAMVSKETKLEIMRAWTTGEMITAGRKAAEEALKAAKRITTTFSMCEQLGSIAEIQFKRCYRCVGSGKIKRLVGNWDQDGYEINCYNCNGSGVESP